MTQLIVLICIASIGLSHGSLDWLLAKHWKLRTNLNRSLIFGSSYLILVLLTVGLWQLTPLLGFSVFLIMSVIHFGNDWQYELNKLARFNLGLALICLPAIRFQMDVLWVFKLLLPNAQACFFASLLHYLGFISIALVLSQILFIPIYRNKIWLVIEIIGLIVVGLLLPPITYFGLYFCLLHAPKHWFSMQQMGVYEKTSQAIWQSLWPTVLCFSAIILFSLQPHALTIQAALIRNIFIALAALTVPHWVLLEVYGHYWRNKP
jgi:Brp/Blh family beta-carotene 15,15'-monooxygenase